MGRKITQHSFSIGFQLTLAQMGYAVGVQST
jgi:hypothetical protein